MKNYNLFDLEYNPYNFDNYFSTLSQQKCISIFEEGMNSFFLEKYDNIQDNKKDDNPVINSIMDVSFIDNETTKLKTMNTLNNIFQYKPEYLYNEDDKDYYINEKKDICKNDNTNQINAEKDVFTYERIKEIFKNGKFGEISEKFVKTKKIENAEEKLYNKKRRRSKIDSDFELCILLDDKNNKEGKNKRGRKIEGKKKSTIDHNNLSEDNVIKKIKDKFFYYSMQFLNKMIKGEENDTNKLYKLNYDYINQIKKENDLKYLNMSLKELFSLKISPKYNSLPEGHNQDIINKIIKKKITVKDYITTMFVLNLSFGSWIELFTYKKTIDQIIKDYEGVNYDSIINNFEGVEVLLKKILDENGEEYFSFFSFLVYNYKRWFDKKRNRKKNEKKNENN